MRKVQFTETVLRDANQSLMATRLPYADYADILPAMDKAGYYSIECWGGATFDSCLRYLNEDPWERLRNLRKNLPNNKLQMLLRGQNLLGYKHYHDDVVEKFIELSIKNGIDIIRIFDALNDFRNCETALNATMKYATKNTIASGCICYTQSPVHTVEKYVEMCKELKRMGFQTICLKDMAGTMTPYEAERSRRHAADPPHPQHHRYGIYDFDQGNRVRHRCDRHRDFLLLRRYFAAVYRNHVLCLPAVRH